MKSSLILTVSLTLSLTFVFQPYAKIDPETVVGLWLFNEGDGDVAEDTSGNDNHGKFVNDVQWVDAKYGKGVELDGGSWLECGNGESLDFKESTNFSIHSILKATAGPTGKCIIWKGLGCSSWSQWFLGTGAHENGDSAAMPALHFRVIDDGDRLEVRGPDPLPEGEMVHIVGTYDGSMLRLYINGALVQETAAEGTPWASPEQVYIGADPGCGNRGQWVGTIYEIKVFNETLSKADLDALAVSPAGKLATTWADIRK